jgi:TDG/mug DNA glycosylase family protein
VTASLPDLIGDGLDIVFVGINPSVFSAERGHYYARPGNRFWPALSRSTLSCAARAALGIERLEPGHDRVLMAHGFGFTDLVKRASPRAEELSRAEFAGGIAALKAKLERAAPRIACCHGMTVWRPIQEALAAEAPAPSLGLQSLHFGRTRLFVAPNPSGGNAHFTLADQVHWYDRLAECLATAE